MTSFKLVCEEAARAGGKVLRDMLGTISVRHKKNRFDLVTEADVTAQKTIEEIVFKAFPEHGLVGEEGDQTQRSVKDAEFRWIVDPLDGTTNYVHGVPFFCTSVALARNNDVLCGVIYNPMTEEFYSAEKGAGAFLNENRIQTSHYKTLDEALVSVSFPTMTTSDAPDLVAFLKSVPVCQAIRRTGSTALNLAYVAAGRFDATWTFGCHPWDVAAGILLIQEAGGVITRPDGTPTTLDDPSPVCGSANTTLHRTLMALLNGD